MKFPKLLLALVAVMLSTLAFAQSGKVAKGVVISSEDNLPVIGASVFVKGTTIGTVTDIDGRFTLAGIPANAASLEVAYKPELHVVLDPDTEVLQRSSANRTVQMGEVASIGGNLGNSDFVATIDNENRQFTFTADGEAAGTVFPSVFIVRPAGYRPFQAYEGKYKFKFSKGEFEVTLVPSDDYTSYIMQGVNDNYEFMLSYDKISGTLSLCGQILKHNGSYAKDGEEYIALIPWAASDGFSTSTTTAGMVTMWNGDEAKPVYTFTDNGKWKSYKVTGFLLKRAKGTAMSSSNNIANITNTAFFPFTGTGKHQLSSVSTLTKIQYFVKNLTII